MTATSTGSEIPIRRWARRSITVPGFLLAWVLVTLAFPLLAAAAVAHDLARGNRLAATRALAMGWIYLSAELAGIAAAAWLWVRYRATGARHDAFLRWNFDLQCWWASVLYRAGVRLYGMRVEIEGDDAVRQGPLIVFARHACIVDNLIPAVLISARHGIRLRWAINHLLLRDPCLDIVGHRLPNCFVRGGRVENEAEVRKVRDLASGLGAGDGVTMYPEGALFSEKRRARALERIRDSAPALLERAEELRHVLPPRLAGSLALLEANEGADAVFCTHTGLEGAATYGSFFGGGLVGQTLRIRFWRVPFTAIPTTREQQVDWLYSQWAEVDRWVAEQHSCGAGTTRAFAAQRSP